MMRDDPAPLSQWLTEPLSPDVAAAVERLRRLDDVARVALMPDVHLSHDVCVGTVLATRERLYPAAVGGDIGCGVASIGFEGDLERLTDAMARVVLGDFARLIPGRVHSGAAGQAPLPAGLEDHDLGSPALNSLRRRSGRHEFGTLGRGNHFAEVQIDEAGRPWAMVHSGSRAMGPAIQAHALGAAGGKGLVSLLAESDDGQQYLADVSWALDYARESRARMLQAMMVVLEHRLGFAPRPETFVDCGHNHVCSELHGHEVLWVHRKGAISAADGVRGLIPGSMGDATVHVIGRGHPLSLCSASHGAGRQMSRTEARARVTERALRRQMRGVFYDDGLAGALREEAPAAYRPLSAVMRAQAELVRIERRVVPVLSYKAT